MANQFLTLGKISISVLCALLNTVLVFSGTFMRVSFYFESFEYKIETIYQETMLDFLCKRIKKVFEIM